MFPDIPLWGMAAESVLNGTPLSPIIMIIVGLLLETFRKGGPDHGNW